MGKQNDSGDEKKRDNCLVREGSRGGIQSGFWFGVWKQRGGLGSLPAAGGLWHECDLSCCHRGVRYVSA